MSGRERLSLGLMLPALPQKGVKPLPQFFGVEANAVPDAKSRQFTALDEPVDGCPTEPERSRYLRHSEQLVRGGVQAAISS